MELEECVRGSLTSSDDVPPWIKNLTFELSCPLIPWKHRVQTRCEPSTWFMERVPEEVFTLKKNTEFAWSGFPHSETKHTECLKRLLLWNKILSIPHTHTHPHIYLYGWFCGFNSRASTFDAYTYNSLLNMFKAQIWMPRHVTHAESCLLVCEWFIETYMYIYTYVCIYMLRSKHV